MTVWHCVLPVFGIWFAIAFLLFLGHIDRTDDFEEILGVSLFWPVWLFRAIYRGFVKVWLN